MSQLFFACLLLLSLISASSCKKQITHDPVSSLNSLVKEYGFIGFQNPLDETRSGTMLGGRPKALAYIASFNECFPEESIERRYDTQHFSKSHSYSFKGGFGFSVFGAALFSAGAKFSKDYTVDIKLDGLTIEYMSTLDITRWYQEGMDQVCKEYLDDVGFIIQSLITDSMEISIRSKKGRSINLSLNNIIQYLEFGTEVEWSIVDEYTVKITTPKYIGYQLGRLKVEDEGRTLYRAIRAEADKFVFESIGLFEDDSALAQKEMVWSNLDEHSIFLK